MSTYLFCITLGNYDFYEGRTNTNILVRCYTPVGESSTGKLAVETGIKCIEWYESYYGIPYPLEKLDMVPVSDFCCGAMENWGLILYRDARVLYTPGITSTNDRDTLILIVAHEIAHQWFGNLVTNDWWTDIWLNEGFATFMQFFCADSIFPELKLWDIYYTKTYSSAKELDSLDSSHPILIDIENPNEISQVFDTISYCKGAGVIRMLHEWVGADNFKKGLSVYLKEFSYKNAKTEDLWRVIGRETDMPVEKVMKNWVCKKGFPFLLLQDGYISFSDGENSDWFVPIFDSLSEPRLLEPGQKLKVEGPVDPCLKGFYTVLETFSDESELGKYSNLVRKYDMYEKGMIKLSCYLKELERIFQTETSYLILAEAFDKLGKISVVFDEVKVLTKKLSIGFCPEKYPEKILEQVTKEILLNGDVISDEQLEIVQKVSSLPIVLKKIIDGEESFFEDYLRKPSLKSVIGEAILRNVVSLVYISSYVKQ